MWAFSQSLESQAVEAHISELELGGGLVVTVQCLETGEKLQELLIGSRFVLVEDRLRVLPPVCPKTGAEPMHEPALHHVKKLVGRLKQGQAIERASAA